MSSRNKLCVIRLPGTTQLLFLVAKLCIGGTRDFTSFFSRVHVLRKFKCSSCVRPSRAYAWFPCSYKLVYSTSTYLCPVFWGCLKLQSAVRPFCAHAANDVFHFLNRKQFCRTFALLLCLKNCYCSRTDNYFYYCLLVLEFLAAFGCGIWLINRAVPYADCWRFTYGSRRWYTCPLLSC